MYPVRFKFLPTLFSLLLATLLPFQILLGQTDADSLEATRQMREGDVLFEDDKYLEALVQYQAAAAQFETLTQWDKCLRCIKNICGIYDNLQDFENLERETERGLRLVEEKFGGRHILKAYLMRFEVALLMQQQQFDKAVNKAQDALTYLEKNYPAEQRMFAHVYSALGLVYFQSGDLQASLQSFQKALEQFRALPGDNEIGGRARALSDMGVISQSLGQYEEALAYFKEALLIFERIHDKSELANTWYHIASVLYITGELEPALEYIEKSESMYLELYGPEHSMLEPVLNLKANVYAALQQFDDAKRDYEKAIAITRKSMGENHPELALLKRNLGMMYFEMGDFDHAFRYQLEALNLYEKIFPTPSIHKAALYSDLSFLYTEEGSHLDSAIYFAQKLYDDGLVLFGPRHPAIYDALFTISDCHLKEKNFVEALNASQKALMAISTKFDNPDIRFNPAPDDFFLYKLGLEALGQKAKVLFGRWKTSRQAEDSRLAFECLEQGKEMIRQLQLKLGDQTATDYDLSASCNQFLHIALHMAATYYAAAPSSSVLDQCFRWMELLKGQTLRQAAQNATAKAFAGLPDSLFQRDATLSHDIVRFEQNLRAAEEAGDSAALHQWRDDSLFYAKRDRETFIRQLEQDFPAYFELKYKNESLSLAELQQGLPPKTLFLEIVVDAQMDNTLYLLAVGPDKSSLHVLTLDGETDANIDRLYALLQSPGVARLPRRREFVQLSHALYQQFIAPIESRLSGVEHLIVCGEGSTQYLPFEVLLREGRDKPVESLDFLIKRTAVSYQYSAGLFTKKQANSDRLADTDAPSLFAFAPVFSDADTPDPGEQSMRDTSLRAVDANGNWSPLPYSEKEVQDIAQLFRAGDPNSVKVLLHEAAGEAALLEALTRDYRFVHIASHSFADMREPKFSGIACSPGNSGSGRDILSVGEIYNIAARADLVVLSSCESGLGKLVRGEGLLGLNRAFRYAGVPNVVYSLWKVNDRATADLMVHFYRAILEGQSYTAALRTAKLKMLGNAATASPNLWGPFLGIYNLD